MNRVLAIAGGLALSASTAMAGGVERSTQSVSILFEPGRYAELNFGYVDPDVSGVLGVGSGNMLGDYMTYSLGYKQPLNERMDLAVILDQPIGANVDYPTGTGYVLAGTNAELRSTAVTALLRYKFPSNVSVIGGLRAESVGGDIYISPLAGLPAPFPPVLPAYVLSTSTDYQLGYVVGIAWEKPEIAARVALSYNSAITHALESTENGIATGSFDTEIPQSVNLEFQTGIAADTLLFGSVRWVDWTAFDISPETYLAIYGSPLVFYESDRVTYNLGVGRKFNETWSGAITLSHEASNGDITGNLGPSDGFTSAGAAVVYTAGNMKITGGLRYVDIGGATTRIGANFEDNSGIAAGVRIAYSY